MAVKTNIGLAKMILEYIEKPAECMTLRPLMEAAAREALAGKDEPDGEHFFKSFDGMGNTAKAYYREVLAGKDEPDCEPDLAEQDELGNMSIALGLVERQRDGLLACAESTLEFVKWLAYGNNCKLDENGLSFLEVTHKGINKAIAKCKAGEPGPTTLARYDEVDDCTIKLYFTEPEDLQKFVANYQPKDKPSEQN